MGFSRVILNQCLAEYIGQTKRALRDRFGEHRRAIQNKIDDAVPQHFYQPGHQLKDIELINAKRESIRRARERSSIEKAQTAATRNKQRGRPLNHLCTHWFHYYYILYFILVYFIIILITIMIIFVYIFFIISNIFIIYYLFLLILNFYLLFYFIILFILLFVFLSFPVTKLICLNRF